MRSGLLIIAAASVEAAALAALAAGTGARPILIAAVLLLHAAVSLLVAVVARGRLPAALGEPRAAVLVALFTLCLLLPLVGALGVVALLAAFGWPRLTRREAWWRETEVPELPFRPIALDGQQRTEGHLAGILRHAPDPQGRLRAVMVLRQLDGRLAVPLLRLALRDAVDDVRLLAYSMLDTKERAIEARIRRRTEALAAASGEDAVRLHRLLAEDHWEPAWLGLSHGEALRPGLDLARAHAAAVLAAAPADAGMHLLLGRILLHTGNLDGADAALGQAESAGIPAAAAAPWRAEAAFRAHRFDECRRHLAAIPGSAASTSALARVCAFWLRPR